MGNIYVSKQTGEKVKILKEEESFYTLDDGVKIKKETFSKRYEQSDEIDPMEFLNPVSALEKLANELKSMDPNKVAETNHGTKIKMKPPTVLADNSRSQINPVDNSSEGVQISEQRKQQMIEEWRMKQELGDPDAGRKPAFMENQPNQDDGYIEYEMPNQGEGRIRQTSQPNQPKQPNHNQPTSQPIPQIDPLQMMFKMFKNNYDITLKFEIEEKIANPAFIEMIMENVDGDAIEFYTKKILDKILKNPLKLKKEIYNQLKVEIYGEDALNETKDEETKDGDLETPDKPKDVAEDVTKEIKEPENNE